MATLIVGSLLSILINTVALAGALYITGGREEITREVLGKCLVVGFAASMFSINPVFGFVSLLLWFGASIGFFGKTVVEAVVIAVACWMIGFFGTILRETFVGASIGALIT